MAKKGVLALLSCMFALCLALAGCGGSAGNNETTGKAAFTGTWDLIEMSQDGETTGKDDLESLKSRGYEVFLNLNEDGSAALVLFGEATEGTWTASSATSGSLSLEGQQINMTIEDSKLKVEQEKTTLVFEKGEAKEVPSQSESVSSSAEEESSSSEASEGAQ